MTLLTIWLLCGIGAAIVASNRGSGGCLWFGLGVLLGPVGLALAFTQGSRCPHCASRISSEAAICPQCQRPLREPKPVNLTAPVLCHNCGAPQPAGNRFCPRCGHKLRIEVDS